MVKPVAFKGFKVKDAKVGKVLTSDISIDDDDLIITPLLRQYLIRNPNNTIDLMVAQRIAQLISTPQRDRRGSWSASSAGLCLRRQELAYLGVPGYQIVNPRQIQIFSNGTWTHLRWQATLLTAGIIDAIEVTHKKNSVLSRATFDAIGIAQIGTYKDEPFLFELKSANQFSYRSQDIQASPSAKTLKQVDFQLWVSGYSIAVTINENKDTQDWSEFIVERDEGRIKTIVADIDRMNSDVEKKRLHPMLTECVRQNRTGEFYKCPFGTSLGACIAAGSWPNGV